MSGGLVLVLVPALGVAAFVVVLCVVLMAVPSARLPVATANARRHAVAGGTLAVVLAGVAMVAVAACALQLPLGTRTRAGLFVLAPSAAGLVHTVVLLLTELTWPRPQGARRTAVVARRAARDIVPRGLLWPLVLLCVLLAAGVVTAGFAADADGLSVTRRTVTHTQSAGTFPGWPVGLPAAGGVAVVLAVSALAVHRAVTRPAVTDADPGTDHALRRASAHRILRGAVVTAALTLGPLLGVGAMVARNVAAPGLGSLLLGLGLTGLAITLTGLVVLCLPAPAVPPADATSQPGPDVGVPTVGLR